MDPRVSKHINNKSQPQSTQPPADSHGFALPLIVIVGMFLMVGGMAMLTRTFGAFRGSIRSSQHNQAQEIAETGMAKVINQLNTTHRYLWLNCHRHDLTTPEFDPASSCKDKSSTSLGNWGTGVTAPSFDAATCSPLNPNTYASTITKDGIVTAQENSIDVRIGDWRVESYTYFGNNFDGGEGLLRVSGRMTSADGAKELATATIEQRLQVRGKPCGAAVNSTAARSSVPGLLAKTMDLGNNDVLGLGADVFCTECDTTGTNAAALGQSSGSQVHGNIFRGEIQMPPVPQFPAHLINAVEEGAIVTTTENVTIQAATTANTSFDIYCDSGALCSNPPEIVRDLGATRPMCVSDSQTPPVSHCLISSITGNGDITINTNGGVNPVRLYISGHIVSTGAGKITSDGGPTDVAMFSTENTCGNSVSRGIRTFNRSWDISGASSLSAFIYAPCAKVGINGGAQTPTCTSSPGAPAPPDPNSSALSGGRVDCDSGDINGAVWASVWDGSNSTNAEITVPANMATLLIQAFGAEFGVGASDFVGIGVKDWASYRAF